MTAVPAEPSRGCNNPNSRAAASSARKEKTAAASRGRPHNRGRGARVRGRGSAAPRGRRGSRAPSHTSHTSSSSLSIEESIAALLSSPAPSRHAPSRTPSAASIQSARADPAFNTDVSLLSPALEADADAEGRAEKENDTEPDADFDLDDDALTSSDTDADGGAYEGASAESGYSSAASSDYAPPRARTRRRAPRFHPYAADPVPVPSMTKQSRGRKVPVLSQALFAGIAGREGGDGGEAGGEGEGDGARDEVPARGRARTRGGPKARKSTGRGGVDALSERTFRCSVGDCGKCFIRAEHLKRHIRSIHTDDKRESSPCLVALSLVVWLAGEDWC